MYNPPDYQFIGERITSPEWNHNTEAIDRKKFGGKWEFVEERHAVPLSDDRLVNFGGYIDLIRTYQICIRLK
jgi:hypothetical protein